MQTFTTELCFTFFNSGKTDSAFYYCLNSIEECSKLKDNYRAWKPYYMLGYINAQNNNFEKAEEYSKKAWNIVEKKNKRMDIGFMIMTMGRIYFDTENYEQFGVFAHKWEEFNKGKNKDNLSLDEVWHVGGTTVFMQDGNHESNLKKLRSAIDYQKRKGNDYMSGTWLVDLAKKQLELGLEEKALQTFLESELLLSQTDADIDKMVAVKNIYELYKKGNEPPLALNYLEKYTVLHDSLRKVEMLKNLNGLQIKYETEKKDQEIKMQALEIKQKTTQNNLLVASSVLLALLATTIFINYRNRIRTNKKLAAQESEIQQQKIRQLEQEKQVLSLNAMIEGQEQERIRIANDLHDGLGGLLTSVKSHFNSINGGLEKNNLFQKTNHLIDEACVEVRRISHNMMPRALTLSGLEGALEDLAENINRQDIKCDLEIMGLKELPHTQSVMVYRLIQELTNNILKHAEANNILLQLLQNQDGLTIIVEDDGKGFNVQEALRKKGLGLSSVQSRVEFLKGKIDWDSVIGEGTTVSVQIPSANTLITI